MFKARPARHLAALEKAVNDAAGKATTTWVGFLSLATYLAITTGAVTHEDLFLETPISLPFLGVKLPVTGYFAVAPLFFLVSHFYALIQLHGLAGKIGDYDALLRDTVPSDTERTLMRQRLDSFLFVQLLAGAPARRLGLMGRLYKTVAWLTMVGAPLVILLQLQLAFLPYHDERITWLHRLAVLADIGLICVFWQQIAIGSPASLADRQDRRLRIIRHSRAKWRPARWATATAVLLFSWVLARFPGEWIYPDAPWTLTTLLFEGEVDEVAGRPVSPFSNRLVLPDKHFVDDDKLKKLVREDQYSLSLRGRDLRKAVLIRSDLRQADFTSANLQEADLRGASLQRASFRCGRTGGAEQRCVHLERAMLQSAQLQGAVLEEAQLRGVSAEQAQLSGAKLSRAELQDASLMFARLQGAEMFDARLQGADLRGAGLHGAKLQRAQLQGANLSSAVLQAASLGGAQLQGANLEQASLQGASLFQAQLQFANLDKALLQGVDLDKADLRGASLCQSTVYRAEGAPRSRLDGARVTALRKPWMLAGTARRVVWPSRHERHRIARQLSNIVPQPALVAAMERLEHLRPGAQSMAQDWDDARHWADVERQTTGADVFIAGRAEAFATLACSTEHGAHVARGLIALLPSAGPHAERFAALLHDPASCPGARGLSREDLSRLDRILLQPVDMEHCGEGLTWPWPQP